MYSKPRLERLGTLRELTRQGFSAIGADVYGFWSHVPQSFPGGGSTGGGLTGGGGLQGGGGGGGGDLGGPYLS